MGWLRVDWFTLTYIAEEPAACIFNEAREFHPAYQSSRQHYNYQVSHKLSCFSWWWAHSGPKHVEIDKYSKNKLCTKLVLFTRLYRDSRSTKQNLAREVHFYWLSLKAGSNSSGNVYSNSVAAHMEPHPWTLESSSAPLSEFHKRVNNSHDDVFSWFNSCLKI